MPDFADYVIRPVRRRERRRRQPTPDENIPPWEVAVVAPRPRIVAVPRRRAAARPRVAVVPQPPAIDAPPPPADIAPPSPIIVAPLPPTTTAPLNDDVYAPIGEEAEPQAEPIFHEHKEDVGTDLVSPELEESPAEDREVVEVLEPEPEPAPQAPVQSKPIFRPTRVDPECLKYTDVYIPQWWQDAVAVAVKAHFERLGRETSTSGGRDTVQSRQTGFLLHSLPSADDLTAGEDIDTAEYLGCKRRRAAEDEEGVPRVKKSKFWNTLQEEDNEASSSKVADGVDLNSEDADAAAGACTGGSVNADEEEVLDGEGEEEEQGVEGSGSGGEHGAVAEDGGKDEADGDEETDDADDAPTTNGSTKAA